ncbi:MAG: efflux RND transporter permease subunit [Acidimicrobiia bacterium]
MRKIIGSSLRLRLLVLAAAAGMMVFGVVRLQHAPRDVYPEFMPTYVEVQTEALGLSAAEVEQFITVPLEANLLNGVAWVETIRSQSVPGLSSIVLVFEPGTELLRARQVVQERLTQAAALPRVSKPPTMLQPVASTSRALVIGMSSEKLSLIELGVLARWNIRPRLTGVPGVANVAVWGQRERQLQVQVDPERLQMLGVSLDQVIETAGNALWVSPLSFLEASTPGTGGFIDGPNQRLGIRHVSPITTPEDLARVSLEGCTGGSRPPRHVDAGCVAPTPDQPSLRLGDVATVVEDHQPLIGDAVVNDGRGLLLVVEKLPWANTVGVTRGVEAALAELRPGLDGVEFDPSIYRPAGFVERAVGNLAVTILIAAILAALVVAALFLRWRQALVALVAVSLSLVAAGVVLHLRGTTFNAMVFAGLVVALAAVVDDAVVASHQILRRLQRPAPDGQSRWEMIAQAALEARGALVFATLAVLLPVLPVFFLDNLTGSLLRPLALSYLLALAVSTAVALTVTPALALTLWRRRPPEPVDPRFLGWLQRGYDAVMVRFLRGRPWSLAVAVVALAGVAVLPTLQRSTVPAFKETDLLIEFDAAPGTSLAAMERTTTRAGKELRSLPGVRNVGAHMGRAIMSDEVVGANAGELWVSIDPGADYQTTVDSIREVLSGYRWIDANLLTYPNERIRDARHDPEEPVTVRIYGDDSGALQRKAGEVEVALSGIDGVVGARVDSPREELTVEVEVDLDAAERFAIKPGDIRRAAATLMQGIEVGSLFEEQKVFDVMVMGTPETRHSVGDLGDLLIDRPGGGFVRLGDVAHVRMVSAPNVIERDAVSRYVDVTAGVSGRDVDAVLGDVREALARIDFPLEHHAELLAGYAERQATGQRVLIVGLAAAAGIIFLLQAAFASWRMSLLFFAVLPLSLVGGAVAALGGGGEVSLGSLAGFLALLGVAVRHGVVLIRHYQHLHHHAGEAFGPELVRRGARERLVPILVTTATVAAAFAPFVLRGDLAGHEILQPMAVVILGGLVTTTLVNLFIVPGLYLRFGAGPAPDDIEIDLRESSRLEDALSDGSHAKVGVSS